MSKRISGPSLALVTVALAALFAACTGGGGGGSSITLGGGGGSPTSTPTATPSPVPTTTGPIIITTTAPQSNCPTVAPIATAAASGGVVANPNPIAIDITRTPASQVVNVSESGSTGPFRATIGDPNIANVDGASQSQLKSGSSVSFTVSMTCNGNTTLSIVDTSRSGATAVVPVSSNAVVNGVIY
jgi:hypothetical protein